MVDGTENTWYLGTKPRVNLKYYLWLILFPFFSMNYREPLRLRVTSNKQSRFQPDRNQTQGFSPPVPILQILSGLTFRYTISELVPQQLCSKFLLCTRSCHGHWEHQQESQKLFYWQGNLLSQKYAQMACHLNIVISRKEKNPMSGQRK